MQRIKIVFGARIDGVEFPEISFADTSPLYKNITLIPEEPCNSRYKIFVDKNVIAPSGDELRSVIHEATFEAQSFVYVFSLTSDIKIFEFTFKGYVQGDSFIKVEEIFGADRMKSTAQLTVRIGQPRIDRLKESMKKNHNIPILQMFFDSATIEEPVGRFISLYTLMLHHCDDKQKKVDEAIINVDSTVAQFSKPQGNYYETVFTKLRNELSHKRNGVNILSRLVCWRQPKKPQFINITYHDRSE